MAKTGHRVAVTRAFCFMPARWRLIMMPKRDRLEFVPPPGVKASTNPFPHGLYYKRAADVTSAVFDHCYPWPTALYPSDDPLEIFG